MHTVYAATMILQKKAWRSVLTSDALVSLYLGSAYPDVLTAGVPWNDEMGPEPDKSGCYTESCSTPTYQVHLHASLQDDCLNCASTIESTR